MENLWKALDLGDNLGRCLRVARGYGGLQAAFMAIVTALIALATGALAWHFDVLSTIGATSSLIERIIPSLPGRVASYATLIILAVTLAPTLMELGGAAFARGGSTPFQWIVIALSIFDLFTDSPETTAFVNQADWSVFGIFEWPAYTIAWVLWLGMSSFFFEMVSICMAITTIALVLRAAFPGKVKQSESGQLQGA